MAQSLLVVFMVTLCVSGRSRADTIFLTSCEPTCPEGSTPGTKTPDPRDCQRYYVCMVDGTPADVLQECPAGQLFDSTTLDCVESSSATCAMCRPTCPFECPQGVSEAFAIADSTDCSVWHLCLGGNVLTTTSCDGDKQYFDGSGCTSDQSQCCNGCTTEPFCSLSYTQVSDPTNCSNFYFCDHVKYPDEGDRYSCGSEYFDPETSSCSEDAPCKLNCGEIVPPSTTPTDGTTTTTTPTTTTTTPTTTTPTTTTTTTPTTVTTPTTTTTTPTTVTTPTTTTTTPATTTTTTQATTTNPPDDCVERFVCQEEGYFPKCPHCDPRYYKCRSVDIGHNVQVQRCVGELLFHPQSRQCVAKDDCKLR